MKQLLRTGFLSGLAGGIAMAAYSLVFARGPLNAALAYEEELTHTGGAPHSHEELFSRGVQEIGGAVGIIIYAIALGLIFSIVLGSLAASLGNVTPMEASVRLGMIGFVVVVLVPFLKYPANPPAVGDPETVNERTLLYFGMLAASILLAVAVHRTVRSSRLAPAGKTWLGFALYLGGVGALFLVLPGPVDAVNAPTDLVWNFRVAALGSLAAAWTVMSLTTGTLLTRATADKRSLDALDESTFSKWTGVRPPSTS